MSGLNGDLAPFNKRMESTRKKPHAVDAPAVGRELLDSDSLSADPRAHRATRMASDLSERTEHRGREMRSGSIPAGVSLRWGGHR
jgi:hypothetical protein